MGMHAHVLIVICMGGTVNLVMVDSVPGHIEAHASLIVELKREQECVQTQPMAALARVISSKHVIVRQLIQPVQSHSGMNL